MTTEIKNNLTDSSNIVPFKAKPPIPDSSEIDRKVYNYVVLGGILMGLAAAGTVAAIVCAIVLNPFAALALIVCVALGALSYPLVAAENVNGFLYMPWYASYIPYIEGQPIGIPRPGHNCWINVALQFLMNAPSYRQILFTTFQGTPFEQQARLYEAAEAAKKTVASEVDTQALREWLSTQNMGISKNKMEQDDPLRVLFYILRGGGIRVPRIEKEKDGYYIELFACNGRDFAKVMEANFTQYGALREAPDDIMVHFARSLADGGKYNEPMINLPRIYRVPKEYVQGATEDILYECDGWINHLGSSSNSGHYVFCNNQWRVDDSRARLISQAAADKARSLASIWHFRRIHQ